MKRGQTMRTIELGENIIQEAKMLNCIERGILIAPDIETNTQEIAPDIERKELLFISDTAPIEPGKHPQIGMACSTEKFYYCNRKHQPQSFLLSQIQSVNAMGKNRFGSYSVGDQILVQLHDNSYHILKECLVGCDIHAVVRLLHVACNHKIQLHDRSELYCLSLSELPAQLQIYYMEVLYNYAFVTDGTMTKEKYSALQSIIVRLGLDTEIRQEIKDYLFLAQQNSRTKTGILLKRCWESMSYGSFEIFRYSLMQDVLYLHVVSCDCRKWYEDPFLNSLQKMLGITDDQVELMLFAIDLHRDMQCRNADHIRLKKELDLLWSRAKTLHIPREAVFCSGSVYSVDTYHGIRKQQKLNASITRQRELMLQSVIRNMQTSLNYAVEELNDVTLRLLDCVKQGNARDEVIKDLSEKLYSYQSYLQDRMQQSQTIAITQLYNRLKASLTQDDLQKLLPQHRELVEQCYQQIHGQYQIRQDLPARNLKLLGRIEALCS